MSTSANAPDGHRTFSPAQARQYLDDIALTYPRARWTGVFALAESLLKLSEDLREACRDEVARGRLLSYPDKIRFGEERGLKTVDEVHVWMHRARENFEAQVDLLLAPPDPTEDPA